MRYSAFGLTFDSEIALPELAACENTFPPDVQIRIGATPERLNTITGEGILYTLNHDEFLLSVEGVGRFYVQHGEEIRIEPAPYATREMMRLLLFDSPMGALLQQKRVFAIRGSAVAGKQGAVLLCGPSGIGKSAIAAALTQKGYPVLADGIVAAALNEDGQMVVLPGKRILTLWEDTISHLGLDRTTAMKTHPRKGLFAFPLTQPIADSCKLSRIFLLTSANNIETVKFEEVSGLNKLNALADVSLNSFFLNPMQRGTQYHSLLTALSGLVPITISKTVHIISKLIPITDQIEANFTL